MKKRWTRVAALALSALMLLGGCSAPASPDDATTQAAAQEEGGSSGTESGESSSGEKTVTMAMTSAWDTFIPFNTTNANSDAVIELVFDKLIVVKADGSFGQRLATDWSIDDETHTKITFKLNENAKWHDGEPVTAVM